MRISELSSHTEIPVATIKFYLRENLLHDGVRTAATQAQYDQSHVARLRLIRALLGPGGLSVAAAHQVIQAIEEPPESVHELLGVAAARLLDRIWRTHSGRSMRPASRSLREHLTSIRTTCARSRNSRSTMCRPSRQPRPYGTWSSGLCYSNR